MTTWRSDEEIGQTVREIRERLGMTAEGFVTALGKKPGSRALVGRWESGKVPVPMAVRYKIAELAEVPLSVFYQPESGSGDAKQAAGEEPGETGASPYDLAREARDLARASAIEDPVLRMVERESVLAVIRTQAVREAAWAARLAEQNAAARELRQYRPTRQTAPVVLGTARARQKKKDEGAA